MRVETKKVYYADDNTIFNDEDSCKKYEASILAKAKHTTYWMLRYMPDVTEGRGLSGTLHIEAYIPRDYPNSRAWVEDWCFKTCGRKLAFIQGVEPMEAWVLQSIDREKFLRRENASSLDSRVINLIVGNRENGLIEKDKH